MEAEWSGGKYVGSGEGVEWEAGVMTVNVNLNLLFSFYHIEALAQAQDVASASA